MTALRIAVKICARDDTKLKRAPMRGFVLESETFRGALQMALVMGYRYGRHADEKVSWTIVRYVSMGILIAWW